MPHRPAGNSIRALALVMDDDDGGAGRLPQAVAAADVGRHIGGAVLVADHGAAERVEDDQLRPGNRGEIGDVLGVG